MLYIYTAILGYRKLKPKFINTIATDLIQINLYMAGDKLEKQNKTESQIQHPVMTPAILFANMIWVFETGILFL